MNASSVLLHILTGLSSASALFLIGSGLSLIFGVTRIVNFAHGSFYMLGLYGSVSLAQAFAPGPLGSGRGAARRAGRRRLGPSIEMVVLRPALRRARALPAARHLRAGPRHQGRALGLGPEDLLGPKAPGLGGA
jgi:branched-chain amino acid transport system permease protein